MGSRALDTLLALSVAAALGVSAPAQSRSGAAESDRFIHVAQAPAAKKEAGTRAARPQEVTVRVLLLSETLKNNPEEYVEVAGVRYIHFRSPRLKAPARPLGDPNLRYPLGKLDSKDGAVILQLLINEKGGLAQADVVCAARGFEKSALESVKGLKFKPAVAKEGPVKSYMYVEFGYGRGFPCIPAPFY